METLFGLLITLGLIVFIAKLFASASQKLLKNNMPRPNILLKTPEPAKVLPFRKKKYLMTQTEHKFFGVLQEIIKDKYFVVPQVALARIIEVKEGQHDKYGPDSFYSNFSRINKKSVDFVIFEKGYFTPLLVIELDDYTHNFYYRRQRDKFLDEALKAAGLNILHIKPEYNYDITHLEHDIFSQLKT